MVDMTETYLATNGIKKQCCAQLSNIHFIIVFQSSTQPDVLVSTSCNLKII